MNYSIENIKNQKVPHIRFRGFSGEWEEKELIDVAYFINENILIDDLTLQTYISTENLLQDFSGVMTASKLPNTKTVTRVKVNDILISNIRPYLKKVWLASFDGGASNDVIVLRGQENIKDKYLIHFIKNEKFINYVMEGAKGVKMPRGDISLIKKYPLSISLNQTEQTKIGDYFQQLDKLIEQKEKKYKKLKQFKKAMLSKMFPKNGADTPEIRFKGFSRKWEEKKLGNIFNYERPDNYIVKSTEYSNDNKTPVLTANKAFILGYTNELNTFNKPSIIFDDFTLDFKFVDFTYMVKSSALKILTINDEKKDSLIFMYNLLHTIKIEIMGHARHYIGVVQPTNVFVPKIEEQTKIGDYFQKLDNQIELQLQEIEKFRNIKKALLAKMFV